MDVTARRPRARGGRRRARRPARRCCRRSSPSTRLFPSGVQRTTVTPRSQSDHRSVPVATSPDAHPVPGVSPEAEPAAGGGRRRSKAAVDAPGGNGTDHSLPDDRGAERLPSSAPGLTWAWRPSPRPARRGAGSARDRCGSTESRPGRRARCDTVGLALRALRHCAIAITASVPEAIGRRRRAAACGAVSWERRLVALLVLLGLLLLALELPDTLALAQGACGPPVPVAPRPRAGSAASAPHHRRA